MVQSQAGQNQAGQNQAEQGRAGGHEHGKGKTQHAYAPALNAVKAGQDKHMTTVRAYHGQIPMQPRAIPSFSLNDAETCSFVSFFFSFLAYRCRAYLRGSESLDSCACPALLLSTLSKHVRDTHKASGTKHVVGQRQTTPEGE